MTAGQGVEGQATRGTPEDAMDRSRIYKPVGRAQIRASSETSEAGREASSARGLGNHPGVQTPWSLEDHPEQGRGRDACAQRG